MYSIYVAVHFSIANINNNDFSFAIPLNNDDGNSTKTSSKWNENNGDREKTFILLFEKYHILDPIQFPFFIFNLSIENHS